MDKKKWFKVILGVAGSILALVIVTKVAGCGGGAASTPAQDELEALKQRAAALERDLAAPPKAKLEKEQKQSEEPPQVDIPPRQKRVQRQPERVIPQELTPKQKLLRNNAEAAEQQAAAEDVNADNQEAYFGKNATTARSAREAANRYAVMAQKARAKAEAAGVKFEQE